MKRLIPTLVLVLVCIGGFWYASSQDFFKEKKPEAPALVTVKKEDVASYTIKNGDTVIEMQQKDGKWAMTKPSPLPLNDYAPAAWVESFNGAKKEKTVDANPSDLAQFGLDKPKQEFTVNLAGGTASTLSVGDKTAVQGFYYAKFNSSPEVFQLSESTVNALAKNQTDFMEKSPVKLNYEQVRSLTVDWKGQAWTITKTEPDKKSYEAVWKLGDKEFKGADASQFLDKPAFLTSDQPAKKATEIKGLEKPELRMEIKEADASAGGKEISNVYVGAVEGDNVWIAKQGGEWAFAVPSASIQEVADLSKKEPVKPETPQGEAPKQEAPKEQK